MTSTRRRRRHSSVIQRHPSSLSKGSDNPHERMPKRRLQGLLAFVAALQFRRLVELASCAPPRLVCWRTTKIGPQSLFTNVMRIQAAGCVAERRANRQFKKFTVKTAPLPLRFPFNRLSMSPSHTPHVRRWWFAASTCRVKRTARLTTLKRRLSKRRSETGFCICFLASFCDPPKQRISSKAMEGPLSE